MMEGMISMKAKVKLLCKSSMIHCDKMSSNRYITANGKNCVLRAVMSSPRPPETVKFR